MTKFFSIKSGYKKLLIGVITAFFLIYLYTDWYWNNVCGVSGCENLFRDGLLAPVHVFSLYSILILLPFLFLPAHYFRAWAIKIASWSVPFATILVLGESPRGGGVLALGRETVVIVTALIIACLTLVFILYTYAKNHERYRTIAGFWYFILLGILLYSVTYPAPFLVG